MKSPLIVAAVVLLLGSFASRALRAQEHEEPESVLEQRMHEVEDELKALRRLVRDPAQYGAALASLTKLQVAALAAKAETPRHTAQIPEAERAKFVADYRREMVSCLERSLALERALLDGNAEAARAAFEALHDMEDSSHERFAPEEEGEKRGGR